ncbi:hypothetical protein, partial [Streptomyces lushanensis]|uniref:hypothetical protein n=1 Tax=Streptomyces lushanensis TaxID=1434255 RepID=UPI001475E934
DELATVREKIKPGTEVNEVMTLAGVDPLQHYTVLVARKDQLSGPSRDTWVKIVAALRETVAFMYDPGLGRAHRVDRDGLALDRGAVGDTAVGTGQQIGRLGEAH